MTSVSTADTWRELGPRADRRAAARPEAADHVSRIGRPPVPPPPPQMRSTELPPFPEDMARSTRGGDDRPLPPRPSAGRASRPSLDSGRSRPVRPGADRPRAGDDRYREDRSPEPHGNDGFDDRNRHRGPRSPDSRRPVGRGATAQARESGSRLGGAVAVLGVFLVTLAAAALESWIGSGLGLVTLLTLTAASAGAAGLVRRGDLLTTVVAPPLVYVLTALLTTALSPSSALNLASVATLLVRGFPAMAVATAAAAVVALVRWAARR